MDSRERVIRCIEFKKPDRPPRDLWPLSYITIYRKEEYKSLLEEFPMDIEYLENSPGYNDNNNNLLSKKGFYTDEWGSVWYIGEPGVMGEVKKPVLADWSGLKKIKPPYYLIKNRDFSFINSKCAKSKKFTLSSISARPFERMQFLRGTENLYMDIAYERTEFFKLLDLVHEFYLEDINSWVKTEVEGIFMMDDWGSNNSLLISPEAWRKLFKPLYKEYSELIHKHGKFVFFHSDGFIEPIIGDLVDIGVDALNSQLFVMNIENIGNKFKKKITFWGEIDRQHTLPFGGKGDVANAVKRMYESLYDEEGGIIINCSWGKFDPLENIKHYFEIWDEHIR